MILSACNVFNFDKDEREFGEKIDENALLEQYEDDKMENPKLLQNDELLMVGDLQVEENSNIKQIQNPPSEYDKKMAEKLNLADDNIGIRPMHHNWKYPSLHPVFINPSVKPMWGNYAENVIQYAWKMYGKPYEYGSDRNDPSSFDCSDFTRWINLYTLGLDLPKTSRSQYEYVKKFSPRKVTSLSQAQRGDLLFFMAYKGWQKQDYNNINVKAQPIAHSGIYLGNGKMLHTASAKTGGVRVDNIIGTHLEYRFVGGGSVLRTR